MEIKRILVPVDFSNTSKVVIPEVIALAKPLKAEVFLLHVKEPAKFPFYAGPQEQIPPPNPNDENRELEKKMIETREEIKQGYGFAPRTRVTSGDVHDEIIKFSKENNIDLIVMGTHGASGYKELFVGSNAQRVVTLSEIPVLTIHAKKIIPGFKNILIPIDNAIHSREKVSLALGIAKIFNAGVDILGLPDSEDVDDVNKFKIKLQSVEHMAKEHKINYTTTIVHGDNLASAAMEYAISKQCDLIVVNTGHESKMTGIFLGAFAQQIVNHSNIPVLSFRHSHSHYSIDTPAFGIG